MKGSTMLTNGSLMGPQGTGPADSVTPGMLSASLAPSSHINAPHINAPRTLAEALAMVVDDEALSSLVLPPLPLAPPGLMTAENCRNGGDTHFLEGTAEQEVVVIDDLDDCDRGVNNEMANAGLRPTGDHQECIAMTKNEDVDITETPTLATPDEIIADALQTAEALESSLAYVLADSKQHPDATYTPTSPRADATHAARSHHDFNAAADEASRLRRRATEILNQSQMQAQKVLDSAQRRAAATVSQSRSH